MKALILFFSLFVSIQSFSMPAINALGEIGKHSCIVTLSSGVLNEFIVSQTCDSTQTPVVLAKISKEDSTEQQILLQVIKQMREKGFVLIQSNSSILESSGKVVHYTFSIQ